MSNDVKTQAYATFHAALKSWHQNIITFEEFMEITCKLTAELKAAAQRST